MATDDMIDEEESGQGLQLDFGKLISKIVKNLHWIILCGIFAFGIAKIYLRYQVPVYSVSANVLINKNESANTIVIGGAKTEDNVSLDNEIFILKSESIIKRVIDSLNLKIGIVEDAHIKQQPIDIQSLPFLISVSQANSQKSSGPFKLKINLDGYKITYGKKEVDGKYDRPLFLGSDTIIIYSLGNLSAKKDEIYHFNIYGDDEMVKKYLSRLSITSVKSGNGILKITLNDEIPSRAQRFVNVLIREYDRISRYLKNQSTIRAIDFVTKRLEVVGEELANSENKEISFLSSNEMYDISTEANSVLNRLNQLDIEKNSAEYNIMLVNVLEEHVRNIEQKDVFPFPIGLTESGLSGLVNSYNALLLKKRMTLDIGTPNDPNLAVINGQLQEVRANILRSISDIKTHYKVNQKYISGLDAEYSSKLQRLPVKEKELVRIKRELTIRENLYKFLLQKREEISVQMVSSNGEGSGMIDAPKPNGVVSPDNKKTYTLFISLGLLLPIVLIVVQTLLNNRVESKKEIEGLTTVPIIGEIVQMDANEPQPVLTIANSKKLITEQFRLLRSNLVYLGLGKEKKVILISSAMSGEGKSFIALNLANILAQAGKKVALLEFDLRRPKISERLSIPNEFGISEYIATDIKPYDIVKKLDEYPNLYLLNSGAVPPNPAELMLNPKVGELFNYLKAQFDYVVIDSAPIGIVSDVVGVASFADISLYVIRHKFTPKPTISYLNQLAKERKLPNPAIVIYGLDKDAGKKYGYGYGYGYGHGYYDNEQSKKSFGDLFRRKKDRA